MVVCSVTLSGSRRTKCRVPNTNFKVMSREIECGIYDPLDGSYRTVCKFTANSKKKHVNYWSSAYYRSPPTTSHLGHSWSQPSLHYNPMHKIVFVGGDDTNCIEGYDVIKDEWVFLPKTK